MTKTELKQKILEFIAQQPDDNIDEWYFSDREMAAIVLKDFANSINIKID